MICHGANGTPVTVTSDTPFYMRHLRDRLELRADTLPDKDLEDVV